MSSKTSTSKSKKNSAYKGLIKNLSSGGNVEGKDYMFFQYNPENFEYSRGATYTEISAPGMSYPDAQFVRGNVRTFPVELFFIDKPHTGLINKYMNFIGKFLPPETNTKDFVTPPEMLFVYGYFVRRCVLEDLNIKVEEFDVGSGEPTIARFTLQLRQVGVYSGSIPKL